mgnify:FL=1
MEEHSKGGEPELPAASLHDVQNANDIFCSICKQNTVQKVKEIARLSSHRDITSEERREIEDRYVLCQRCQKKLEERLSVVNALFAQEQLEFAWVQSRNRKLRDDFAPVSRRSLSFTRFYVTSMLMLLQVVTNFCAALVAAYSWYQSDVIASHSHVIIFQQAWIICQSFLVFLHFTLLSVSDALLNARIAFTFVVLLLHWTQAISAPCSMKSTACFLVEYLLFRGLLFSFRKTHFPRPALRRKSAKTSAVEDGSPAPTVDAWLAVEFDDRLHANRD